MFIGHYGVALAAKRAAPGTSLGTFILAAQLADLLWPIMLLLGLESVRVEPGATVVTPLAFEHYPITHSLLALFAWAALVAGVYAIARRYVRGTALVGGLVLSHWLLDLVVHRPDLPLVPGAGPRLGLGLWNSLPATLALELSLLALGFFVYARSTRASDRAGRWGLMTLVGLLVVIYVANVFGPPPSDVAALPFMGLTLWLFVPLGYWVDRHRMPLRPHAPGDQASSRSVSASAVTGNARGSSASISM